MWPAQRCSHPLPPWPWPRKRGHSCSPRESVSASWLPKPQCVANQAPPGGCREGLLSSTSWGPQATDVCLRLRGDRARGQRRYCQHLAVASLCVPGGSTGLQRQQRGLEQVWGLPGATNLQSPPQTPTMVHCYPWPQLFLKGSSLG